MGVDIPHRGRTGGVRPGARLPDPGFDEGAVHRPDLRRAVCHWAARPGFRYHLQTAASHPIAMVSESVVIGSPKGEAIPSGCQGGSPRPYGPRDEREGSGLAMTRRFHDDGMK